MGYEQIIHAYLVAWLTPFKSTFYTVFFFYGAKKLENNRLASKDRRSIMVKPIDI